MPITLHRMAAVSQVAHAIRSDSNIGTLHMGQQEPMTSKSAMVCECSPVWPLYTRLSERKLLQCDHDVKSPQVARSLAFIALLAHPEI